jgi:hypothetical protein
MALLTHIHRRRRAPVAMQHLCSHARLARCGVVVGTAIAADMTGDEIKAFTSGKASQSPT